MTYYIKNISDNYAWILKNSLGPGETLNLDRIFKGLCQPKAGSRKERETARFAEFNEDEFDEFMDWVQSEIMTDKGKFELVDDKTLPEYADDVDDTPVADKMKKRRAMRKAARPVGDVKVRGDVEALKEKRVTHKQLGRRLPSEKDLSPKEIAWLPYDGVSRKIIDGIDDMRRLKTAFRLVRNISGQERTRKLIEDRINELSVSGR